jgi:uncharacterized protein YsxB (DUF464 family)
MTRAVIRMKDNHISAMEIFGHALFAETGQDIVCAGISCVVFGGINTFAKIGYGDDQINIENNIIYVELDDNIEAQMIAFTILTQLETIQDQFPDHISIILK